MKRGLFITMEGPDGSGKSTQIAAIEKYFEEKGQKVLLTREPGGTRISEKIRELLLDKANSEMDPMAEALLYAASRAQLVSQVIKPALDEGINVICDRFVDSSIAYQAYGRGLGGQRCSDKCLRCQRLYAGCYIFNETQSCNRKIKDCF